MPVEELRNASCIVSVPPTIAIVSGFVNVCVPDVHVSELRPSIVNAVVPLCVIPDTVVSEPYIVLAVVLAHAGVLVTPVHVMLLPARGMSSVTV